MVKSGHGFSGTLLYVDDQHPHVGEQKASHVPRKELSRTPNMAFVHLGSPAGGGRSPRADVSSLYPHLQTHPETQVTRCTLPRTITLGMESLPPALPVDRFALSSQEISTHLSSSFSPSGYTPCILVWRIGMEKPRTASTYRTKNYFLLLTTARFR